VSLTLDQIYALVEATPEVELTADSFEEMGPILAALGVDRISVAAPSAGRSAGTVTLTGTVVLLGLTGAAVTMTVTGDLAHQVSLRLALPADWRFPDSFPNLPPSYKRIGPKSKLVSLQPTFLGDLAFTHSVLTVQNYDGDGRPSGLSFDGVLADASMFTWLATALDVPASPTLAGPVVLGKAGVSSLRLALQAGRTSLEVGTFLTLDPVGIHLTTGSATDGSPITLAELDATLAIGTEAPLKVALSAPFHSHVNSMALAAVFPDKEISLASGLAALSELVGGPAGDLTFPPGMNVVGGLYLKEVSTIVDITAGRVQHLQFAVQSDEIWTIAEGISVSGLSLGWLVLSPFSSASRSISASLSGTLAFGAGPNPILFDIAAFSHAGFVIEGALRDGCEIKLIQLVASAIGRSADGLPEIDVTALAISASTTGDFSLDAELAAWGLDIPGVSLSLNRVSGSFQRTSAGSSGSIAALLTLGKVQLWVSAAIPSPGAAFQFAGETYGDAQLIPLGDMADALAQTFKVSLPDALVQWLDAIVLTKVRVAFDDQSGNFAFVARGNLSVLDSQLAIELDIAVTHDPDKDAPNYTAVTTGTVTLGTRQFTLLLQSAAAGSMLAAHYTNSAGDAIDIKSLVAEASASLGAVIPDGIGIDARDVALVVLRPASGTQIAFGLGLDASLDLTDLPLVGEAVPSDAKISVSNLHFTYSSAALDPTAAAALVQAGLSLPAQGIAPGVNVSADLTLAGEKRSILLGVPAATASPAPAPSPAAAAPAAAAPAAAAAVTAPPPSTGAKYFELQKQLGPIDFRRMGVQYSDNVLMFLLDASIQVGPLSFSMDGLGVGSPLTRFDPQFDLAGLGLSYDQPPVEIQGALLKLPGSQLSADTKFQFDGTLVVKAGAYSLAAIGSYAQQNSGDPSLFLFAQAEAPLGGPPAFFITGLMAGFGYNRLLRIPGQDEVLDFPLLQLASATGQDPMAVLSLLENGTAANPKPWITASSGEDWAAIGVEFTSFELVHSKALLIVEFGRDFQATLLGLSTITLPQPTESGHGYVYAELELEAVLKPQEGYFGLTAILSKNSYVLTPDCHLTGGFAFSIWYGPSDHSGEFVLTLGGYHPAFKPPSYFPQVPRLGFNWAVSDHVTVKGDAYFALTSSVAMGGGGLEILFHDGDLQAWFTAQADFLVSWHPFFFVADIDVSIGVSYRVNLLFCHKTISVSVGASVHMWGPPTGGTVHVHLWIVSFSVDFGADESDGADQKLEWNQFKNLLPKAPDIVRITATSGLTGTLDPPEAGSLRIWAVRAGSFSFTTRSAVPASTLAYGDMPAPAASRLSIRPMNLNAAVDSVHQLTLLSESAEGVWTPQPSDGWTLTPQTGTFPDSLWGVPPADFSQIPSVPSANVIADQLTGYAVTAPPAAIGASRGLVGLSELAEELIESPGIVPAAPISAAVAPTAAHLPDAATNGIADIGEIEGGDAAAARQNLFAILTSTGNADPPLRGATNGPLSGLAARAGHLFSDAPMEVA